MFESFSLQLINMITLFKENYIQCCMKCVKISEQLFIKIDSEIIYNYSTFTELLVGLIVGMKNEFLIA